MTVQGSLKQQSTVIFWRQWKMWILFYHHFKTFFQCFSLQIHFKNVNNCVNTNINSYLETSGDLSNNQYWMLFIFSTPVFIRHLWQLKTVVFLHWCLICTEIWSMCASVWERATANLERWMASQLEHFYVL